MCAAIHAVTNGLIEYFVYTTLMYTQPFVVYMRRPWMTIRHCRMRLNGIEEILAELIQRIAELHDNLDKIVVEDDE